MEEIFVKNTIIVFGALFTAIVAGFFAFMNLIVSKEQKVSEFRQEWIDSLRNSVSCYISSLAYLSSLYKHYIEIPGEKKNKFEMTKDIENVYSKVNESYNDIIFRINENEDNHEGRAINNRVLQSLSVTRKHFNNSEFAEARKACDELREATKPLLKYEWKRVKAGEKNYRYAKYFSAFILCVGISIATMHAYFIWNSIIT